MKKEKTYKIIIALLSVILVLTLTFAAVLGIWHYRFVNKYSKLLKIEKIVNSDYFGTVDEKELENSLCDGYVEGIGDKYAFYSDATATEKRNLDTNGKAVGIGIYVREHPESKEILVIRVMENSPAEKSGIAAGDTITAVNGKAVKKAGYDESVNTITSAGKDKKVKLAVKRGDENLTFDITCKQYTTQNVYWRMIGNYGLIEVISFDNVTYGQFKKAVSSVTKQNAKGIIFNLRNNGGGTVSSMCKMLDLLVGEGDLLTVKYANGSSKKICHSDKNEVDLPMAVLVNGSTASAAEIFAATLRDYGKAVLIGEKTFGKCVMQQSYQFADGTSMRMTIAKCYTKSGYDFNGKGLLPDIKVKLTNEQTAKYELLSDKENPLINSAVKWLDGYEKK